MAPPGLSAVQLAIVDEVTVTVPEESMAPPVDEVLQLVMVDWFIVTLVPEESMAPPGPLLAVQLVMVDEDCRVTVPEESMAPPGPLAVQLAIVDEVTVTVPEESMA